MRTTFYPIRQFQLEGLLAAGSAATPVGLGIAGAQTALGIVQAISGGKRAKRLLAQRKAYQTPEEIFKILNATESNASSGYGPETLSYLTGQVERALGGSLKTAERLGGDPNILSALLDRSIQSSFKIGAENQIENMKKFQNYISSLNLVAENNAAEQKSQQDLIKDQLQAAGASQQAGLQNIGSGLNTALATASAIDTSKLYTQSQKTVTNPVPDPIDLYIRTYEDLQKNKNRSVRLG